MNTNIQEVEEQQFNHETEGAMCVQEASLQRGELQSGQNTLINNALAAGRYVVVVSMPHFCRATDALVGSVRHFHSSHLTRTAAELAAMNAFNVEDGEAFVFPAVRMERVLADCGLPF